MGGMDCQSRLLGMICFLGPKVVENGVILDVQCLRYCKGCGLDVVLSTPGFMLSDSQDGEDLVLKWLPYSVAV